MQFSSIFSAALAASVVSAESMPHHSSKMTSASEPAKTYSASSVSMTMSSVASPTDYPTTFDDDPYTYTASPKATPTYMPNGTNTTTGSPVVVSGNSAPSLLSQNGVWITVAGLGAVFAVFM
ncbi:uncharacterized protein L3040_003247 [Drepanopeziza brunnea f. sp. 'multigermtubi']|uniref:Uncharacterized protein n=1 Tax=Marssonina brunnea f. sp. multigermtubi (strain MB_m1) TaxID=1072389 RepID=K1WEK7_MARBU|nr:uncharacterized protein MBM_05906 [Drepanopeziza brunnea f. sp. 'multigermtubi' MB_m1]EKD15895.1 hypothetical protein MBM_05906 [Drepanopeziza brunnea f. sp. 'multigermtubi' MB_m1]KAJ5047420.1 hypothetical protein L3040_003247 [Drepanopeziza brunnea f. sp. 'multigermtubi']